MNDLARILIAVPALLFSAGAAAQTVKCVDAAGKVTYTSSACASLGLKDAGEVRDQLNVSPAGRVVPFTPPPAPAPAQAPAAAKAPVKVPDDLPPGTIVDKGRDDDRRCFKTAKGFRCNETPE